MTVEELRNILSTLNGDMEIVTKDYMEDYFLYNPICYVKHDNEENKDVFVIF